MLNHFYWLTVSDHNYFWKTRQTDHLWKDYSKMKIDNEGFTIHIEPNLVKNFL